MNARFEHHIMDHANEVAMIEFLHDLAMTGNPTKACAARCFKELMPALCRWLDKENERRTDPIDALKATTDIAVSTIFTVAINMVDDTKAAGAAVDIIKGKLDEQFAAARERLRLLPACDLQPGKQGGENP